MKKISTLIGILIIMAVAIVFFGGFFVYRYYFSSKLEVKNKEIVAENLGWKVYQDSYHRYSIEYPADVYMDHTTEEIERDYGLVPSDDLYVRGRFEISNYPIEEYNPDTNKSTPQDSYYIMMTTYITKMGYDEFIKEDIEAYYDPMILREKEDIKINGIDAVRVTVEYFLENYKRVYIKYQDKMFLITYPDNVSVNMYQDIFEKIVNSFKTK